MNIEINHMLEKKKWNSEIGCSRYHIGDKRYKYNSDISMCGLKYRILTSALKFNKTTI